MAQLGCLVLIIFFIGVPFLIPKLIIWLALGLFNVDLADKYWYLFWACILLNMLFGGVSIKVGGK